MNQDHSNKLWKDVKASFEEWTPTPDGPSESVWENLSESLSTERVWHSLDESLKAEGSDADQWIKTPYENWDAEINSDGWSKLNEELSREKVWNQLVQSLSIPTIVSMNWMRIVATLLLFVSISFPLVNEQVAFQKNILVGWGEPKSLAENTTTSSSVRNGVVSTANDAAIDPIQYNQIQNDPIIPNELVVLNNTSSVSATESTSSNEVIHEDRVDLERKMNLPSGSGRVQRLPIDFHRSYTPSFYVAFGPQFSIINSSDQNSLMTQAPRIGLAASAGYRKSFKTFFVDQNIGFSQFSQTNGRYINGRYFNSNQRLNTLQVSTSAGIVVQRVELSAGVNFTKVVNGNEQQLNKITNVYNATALQLGLTGELGMRLTSKEKPTQIGVGIKYQWIPSITTSNVQFNDVQGLTLKTKISF